MKIPFLPIAARVIRYSRFEFRGVGIALSILTLVARAVDPPAPLLAPDGGTFTTTRTVNVTLPSGYPTVGVQIYYTRDGRVPTTTDSTVVPGGTIFVDRPTTLTLKTFENGQGSALKVATYNITGQVSTSGYHTLILRNDGTVWAAGLNTSGQLGDGTTTSRIIFSIVPNLPSMVAVAAGGSHSLALGADGKVWSWGSNTNLQCGNPGSGPHLANGDLPLTVEKIAAGATHSVALTSVASGGHVYTWGGGASGQQGNGSLANRAESGATVLPGVKDIATNGGASHTIALMIDGTVKCWGWNSYGQCGGAYSYTPTMLPVSVNGVVNILAIAAGNERSVAVKGDGTVVGWGDSTYYGTPTTVAGLTNVRNVAVGNGFTLALKNDGSVYAVGSNSSGQLGNGTGTTATSPVLVAGLGPVAVIAAGGLSSIGIETGGGIFAWGSNSSGALGVGIATQKNTPIQLLSENSAEVTTIGSGGNHNIISHVDLPTHTGDSFFSWGLNTSGQLGANDLIPYAEPRQILSNTGLPGNPPVKPLSLSNQVAAVGNDFSVVVNSDGNVLSSGMNNSGQLGNLSSIARSLKFIPVNFQQIAGQPSPGTFSSVGAGRSHGMAVTSSGGKVYAWGAGSSGALGNGTTVSQSFSPVLVGAPGGPEFGNVVLVNGGESHSIALKLDGTVWAWGSNLYGQIGNTITTDKKIPNQVGFPGTALSYAIFVDAGLRHSVAAIQPPGITGYVAAWGDNSSGQLGDNTTTNRSLPISISIPNNTSGVARVAAGYAHSLALMNDGTVWAWGRNVEGQLGTGNYSQSKVPVQVVGLAGVVAIAAGDYHNIALKADGGLATWGSNSSDQLGTGVSLAQLRPLIVPGINILHGAPEVTIQTPAPNTFAVGEPFKLNLTLKPAQGRVVTSIAYFSDGFPLQVGEQGGEYFDYLVPEVSSPPLTTPRVAELSSDTWGDLHITAISYDENYTPSFPSNEVIIHVPPAISLTATEVSSNAVQLTWVPKANVSSTYRVERRLPGGSVASVQSDITAQAFTHSPVTFERGALYRVVGLNGNQETARSVEVPISQFYLGSDGDGMADSWETRHFGGVNATKGGAAEDFDNDHISNLLEYLYHLDPSTAAVTDSTGRIGLEVFTPHDPLN